MRATLLLCSLCATCEAFASVRPAPLPRAAAASSSAVRPALISMQTDPKAAETNKEAEDGSGGIRQLLGLKGASEVTGEEFLNWKIRLQLTKPATWVPLIWGVGCGAAASGNYHALWNLFGDGTIPSGSVTTLGLVGTDALKGFCAMILAGPFSCGFTQTINDWYSSPPPQPQLPSHAPHLPIDAPPRWCHAAGTTAISTRSTSRTGPSPRARSRRTRCTPRLPSSSSALSASRTTSTAGRATTGP